MEVLEDGVANKDLQTEATVAKAEDTDGQSIERTKANEKLLLEAYSAKSAGPQDDNDGRGGKESLEKILKRMTSAGGVEVLKVMPASPLKALRQTRYLTTSLFLSSTSRRNGSNDILISQRKHSNSPKQTMV